MAEDKNNKKVISAKDILNKMKDVYKKKKRDYSRLCTGNNLPPPPFYLKAPEPIQQLMGMEGYPGQRIIQISGKPNSGKTTLAILAMIAAQKSGMHVIFVDTEGKFSESRFKKMGGDPNEVLMVREKTLEMGFVGLSEALEIIYSMDPNAKVLIVWDSIGNTSSEKEYESNADDTLQLSIPAKIIKRNLRVLVPKWISEKAICAIFINTSYANIGSHGRSNHGGDGLEYFSSVIMQLTRTSDIVKQVKGEKLKAGIETKAKVTKNHDVDKEFTLHELPFKVLAYSVDFKVSKKKEDENKNN